MDENGKEKDADLKSGLVSEDFELSGDLEDLPV